MLLIGIAWILLSISFLGLGKLIASGFGPPHSREDFSETGYFFMGLSLAGILSGICWVFVPVSALFGGFVVGIGLGYALACYPFQLEIRFRNPWFLAALVMFLSGLLMKSASPTSFYDCGLYYIQTVRWVQQYAVVPGLANLHIRFGNASAWHMLIAAFDHPSLFKGSFDDLGQLVLFWFLMFHSWNVLKLEGFERYFSLGLAVFALWQSWNMLDAPSPDLAAGILGMQTLWQFRKFLRLWNPREPHQLNTRGLALFIQSLFLAQVKLSAIPFLVIAGVVVFLIAREGWYVRVFQLVFLGTLVVFSMVARSYILTGYLLFPVFHGGFHPDWLVNKLAVKEYLDGVKGFARHILTIPDYRSGRTYEEYGRLPFRLWFPLWVYERRWSDWLVIGSGVLGWLFLVRYASMKIRMSFNSHWPLIFFTWLSGMMLLFWFSNAPDVRFGMAILGIGFSYTLATIMVGFKDVLHWSNPVSWGIPVFILGLLTLIFYRDFRSIRSYRLHPAGYHKVEIESFSSETSQPVFTPKAIQTNPYVDADQCWDSPLPCTQNAFPGIEFRGPDLGSGFRIRPVKPE